MTEPYIYFITGVALGMTIIMCADALAMRAALKQIKKDKEND